MYSENENLTIVISSNKSKNKTAKQTHKNIHRTRPEVVTAGNRLTSSHPLLRLPPERRMTGPTGVSMGGGVLSGREANCSRGETVEKRGPTMFWTNPQSHQSPATGGGGGGGGGQAVGEVEWHGLTSSSSPAPAGCAAQSESPPSLGLSFPFCPAPAPGKC